MRIKLKRGCQKELILLAKSKHNLSWKSLSQKIGINEHYLMSELRKEQRLLSDEIYRVLTNLADKNFDKFIEAKLPDDWGRSKGGKTNVKPRLLIEEQSVELAEFIGIILGDGNLWEKEGGYHYVRICGHIKDDRDYLVNYVKPLFQKLFNLDLNITEYQKSNKLLLYKGSRDAVFTLKHFGLKTGNKLKNDVGIPDWIFESRDYLIACIRGMVDTDGSVCPITGRNYSYIWFSSNIPNLRRDFEKAMKILEIKISKWNMREGHAAETYIGGKSSIERFFKEVGFSNPKHRKKFHAPVV